jgi:hypothetical protein
MGIDERVGYDLYLVPARAGDDPGELLEKLGGPDAGAVDEALVAVVLRNAIGLEVVRSEANDVLQVTSWTTATAPFQLLIYGDHATASMLDWEKPSMHAPFRYEMLFALLAALAERSGWQMYDPQLDRIVDPAATATRRRFLGLS